MTVKRETKGLRDLHTCRSALAAVPLAGLLLMTVAVAPALAGPDDWLRFDNNSSNSWDPGFDRSSLCSTGAN